MSQFRDDLSTLVKEWIANPSGMQYDNGFCDSEMLASAITPLLRDMPQVNDQELADVICKKVTFHEAGMTHCHRQLQASMNRHGFEITIVPEQAAAPTLIDRARRVFRR